MKRTAGAISLLALVAMTARVPAGAAESEPKGEPKNSRQETYESPILTLLLLPVNVLIKAASVLGPGEKPPAGARGDDEASRAPR